mmetsp:Transcript_34228/g.57948  ORF Transcript_34228/g.57948 Transcript_34228/m.57948 type:complete len:166 (+) Transcript_34228:94-591(+)
MSSKREDQHLIGQFDTAKLPAREGTEYTTMVNTIKSIVGTGVLTLPYAISVAGIIPGMISFAMIGVYSTYILILFPILLPPPHPTIIIIRLEYTPHIVCGLYRNASTCGRISLLMINFVRLLLVLLGVSLEVSISSCWKFWLVLVILCLSVVTLQVSYLESPQKD